MLGGLVARAIEGGLVVDQDSLFLAKGCNEALQCGLIIVAWRANAVRRGLDTCTHRLSQGRRNLLALFISAIRIEALAAAMGCVFDSIAARLIVVRKRFDITSVLDLINAGNNGALSFSRRSFSSLRGSLRRGSRSFGCSRSMRYDGVSG